MFIFECKIKQLVHFNIDNFKQLVKAVKRILDTMNLFVSFNENLTDFRTSLCKFYLKTTLTIKQRFETQANLNV